MKVAIQPIGEVSLRDLKLISSIIRKRFKSPTIILKPREIAFLCWHDPKRKKEGAFGRQLDADYLLGLLGRVTVSKGNDLTIGVTNEDMSPFGMTFAYGYACIGKGACVISLKRLLGENKNRTRAVSAIHRVVTHEVLHTQGLIHCTNPCLMRSVPNMDQLAKLPFHICAKCALKLRDLQ